MKFSERLKKARSRHVLTQREMALLVGISQPSYNNLENGTVSQHSTNAQKVVESGVLERELSESMVERLNESWRNTGRDKYRIGNIPNFYEV